MKTILVTGATGAQGGSVARFLLKGNYHVKCLTRNPDSDAAKALKGLGAEIVKGDLADKASIVNAIQGCDGVFGTTNFWEHFDGELQHGHNLIDAVEAAGISHFVLSSLPSSEKLSGGALSVPHFETKAKMENYCRTKEIPTTFVHPAFYYENFLSFFPPQRYEDGIYRFGFPQGDTPLAGIAIEDLGGIVAPIFDDPDRFIGETVGAVAEDIPAAAYASAISEVLGQDVQYSDIPREVFAGFGFPGADDLATMFTLNKLYILNRTEEKMLSHELFPGIQSFKQWLQSNKEQFDTFFK
jgi:uncharacterized protein YbjT (DUF2867 family)